MNIYEQPITYEVNLACNVCGYPVKERMGFCPKCGNKMDRTGLINVLDEEIKRIEQITEQLSQIYDDQDKKHFDEVQSLKNQIDSAKNDLETKKNQIESGEEIKEEVKTVIAAYDEAVKAREEQKRLYESEKEKLEASIKEKSNDTEKLIKKQNELIEKIELSKLYCPDCGLFVGRKRYCGRCGYEMRKGNVNDTVSKM